VPVAHDSNDIAIIKAYSNKAETKRIIVFDTGSKPLQRLLKSQSRKKYTFVPEEYVQCDYQFLELDSLSIASLFQNLEKLIAASTVDPNWFSNLLKEGQFLHFGLDL